MSNFLDRFSDIGVPGRRAPMNRAAPAETVTDTTPVWDDKPLKYLVKGVEQEFFTIGAVATALGVSVQSIRAWEQKGLMPRSPYRSPRPRRAQLPDKASKGRRLWTREQVDGILRLAREEGVILNRKPPTPRFAQRVSQLFIELIEKRDMS